MMMNNKYINQKNILLSITLFFVAVFVFIIVKSYKIAKIRENIDDLPIIKSNNEILKIKREVKELKIDINSFYDSFNDNKEDIKIIEKDNDMTAIGDNFVLEKKINKIINSKNNNHENIDYNNQNINNNKKIKKIETTSTKKQKDISYNGKINDNSKTINNDNISNNYYKVQLIALKNKQQADIFIEKTKKKYSDLLKNLNIFITEINLNEKGIFYRVQIGNFNTRGEAINFCKNYIKYDNKNLTNCIIVK